MGIVRQNNARVLHPQRGPPWQARRAAALRTATTTRHALVVAAARCRSLNTQAAMVSQDTASAPRAQIAPTTRPELAWPATQDIMWSRARRLTHTSTPLNVSGHARPTIRAATHRDTTLPITTAVRPRQPRVVGAARRDLICAHPGYAVTIFAATKLLRTVVAHLLVIPGLAPVAPGSWRVRRAAALRTATTTRRALVVAAARCRSLNTQAAMVSQDTASAPRAQIAPTTRPELAWPATQDIMRSRARRLTHTSTPLNVSGHARPTIRAATHRDTTLPITTAVRPRQPRVVGAARRDLICAHPGYAVTIFAATKLLRTVVAHLLVIPGLAPVAPGSWRVRRAAALRTATTTRRALVVAAARCRSLNTQAAMVSQDTASAPRAQIAPTTRPELAWPATQDIMRSRARRLTHTSTPLNVSGHARPTIRAATHRDTTLPITTAVRPRQPRVVGAARRDLICAHPGYAVTIFAATKLLHS